MKKQYAGADRAINYLFENAKEVSIQRYLTTGTLIATLSIDDTTFDLYSAGGDNVAWNQLSRFFNCVSVIACDVIKLLSIFLLEDMLENNTPKNDKPPVIKATTTFSIMFIIPLIKYKKHKQ